jgi:hypothetical protein
MQATSASQPLGPESLRNPSRCRLTPRSAPTRYGKPACPCGTLVYAAPHGQAVPPPRSVLARTLGSTSRVVGSPPPLLRLPPQRHALWLHIGGFFGLRPGPHGLRSTARHRSPPKAGLLREFRGAHQPLASVPAGAKAPGKGSHLPQTLGIHLSVLPNPSLSRDPTRQAAWAS